MKRLLIFLLFLPLTSMAQVNIWVSSIPDTLKIGQVYNISMKLGKSSNFSSLMMSLEKSKELSFLEISSRYAKTYDYKNVRNVLWTGYDKEIPQVIKVKFKVNDVKSYSNLLEFKIIFSYLINGLKGEQLIVYRYVLRRQNNFLVYVLEE